MHGDLLESIVDIISSVFPFLLMALILFGLLRKIFSGRLAKTVTVNARVADKYATTGRTVSRLPSTVTCHVVVFDTGKKSLRFFVSVWVFDSLQKGENGTLRYKGDRFIDFE